MFNNYVFNGPLTVPGFKFLLPFVILDFILKGFALWRAAQRKQLYWFIALMVINSLGILPAIYLTYTGKTENRPSLNAKKTKGRA